MGTFTEQLKHHLNNATPEQLENEFFTVQCVIRGINPELPDAEKQLKKLLRKEKWDSRKPVIRLSCDIFVTSMLYMGAGMYLVQQYYWLFALNIVCGSYFMYKTLKDSKRLW
jgi:hypothetical protein